MRITPDNDLKKFPFDEEAREVVKYISDEDMTYMSRILETWGELDEFTINVLFDNMRDLVADRLGYADFEALKLGIKVDPQDDANYRQWFAGEYGSKTYEDMLAGIKNKE